VNRTLIVQELATAGIPKGELAAPSCYVHPERGTVACQAADLLAESAGAKVTRRLATGQGNASAVLFAVSFVPRNGPAAGFALGAHRDDPAGLAAAERAVRRWVPALRSRRLVVADAAPSCMGAERARAMLRAGGAPTGEPYVVGRPPEGGEGWRGVAGLDEVPDGARVFFPAHGVPLTIRAEAAARGLDTIDGTCPLVLAAQADVTAYAGRGDRVILIGDGSTAAAGPLAAQASEATEVAGSAADLDKVNGAADGVSFVVIPGSPVEDAFPVIEAARRRFPRLRGHHFDALCYATSERRSTIRSVAAESDLVLVVGSAADDDCRRAAATAGEEGAAVRVLERLADLDPERVARAATIGLVAAASAPAGLVERVERALSGLGPLSTVHRRVTTQTGSHPGRPPWSDERAPVGGPASGSA
jgi:4-hydroxy-3-methylbut-2-enyl diphosphate reductase